MSLQACRIKGYGCKFNYEDYLFSFINDIDEEQNFIDIIDMESSYYDFKKQSDSKENNLKIITDGMNGEYKYVLFVTEVSFVENTHGDSFWVRKFRDDKNWFEKYAKSEIETLLQKEIKRIEEIDFLHYS